METLKPPPDKICMLATDTVTILIGDKSLPDRLQFLLDGSCVLVLKYESLTSPGLLLPEPLVQGGCNMAVPWVLRYLRAAH